MEARVVVDLEEGGVQGFGDLVRVRLGLGRGEDWERGTLRRIASSIGVWEAMVESGRRARAKTERRSIKTAVCGVATSTVQCGVLNWLPM